MACRCQLSKHAVMGIAPNPLFQQKLEVLAHIQVVYLGRVDNVLKQHLLVYSETPPHGPLAFQ